MGEIAGFEDLDELRVCLFAVVGGHIDGCVEDDGDRGAGLDAVMSAGRQRAKGRFGTCASEVVEKRYGSIVERGYHALE